MFTRRFWVIATVAVAATLLLSVGTSAQDRKLFFHEPLVVHIPGHMSSAGKSLWTAGAVTFSARAIPRSEAFYRDGDHHEWHEQARWG